jgi:energy-converting hydrogenase Eha subunit H
MKTILLCFVFIFSINLAQAEDGIRVKSKHTNNPKKKVTYREHKYQKRSIVKKLKPTGQMFAGEGQINGLHRFSKW